MSIWETKMRTNQLCVGLLPVWAAQPHCARACGACGAWCSQERSGWKSTSTSCIYLCVLEVKLRPISNMEELYNYTIHRVMMHTAPYYQLIGYSIKSEKARIRCKSKASQQSSSLQRGRRGEGCIIAAPEQQVNIWTLLGKNEFACKSCEGLTTSNLSHKR